MKIFTSRRGVLLGGLTSAVPLPGWARGALDALPASDVSIPMAQLAHAIVSIEAHDATGARRIARAHIYRSSEEEMAIAAEPQLLADAQRLVLTISVPKGVFGWRKTARIALAASAVKQTANAHLAIVANANWHRVGNDWHLQVA